MTGRKEIISRDGLEKRADTVARYIRTFGNPQETLPEVSGCLRNQEERIPKKGRGIKSVSQVADPMHTYFALGV